MVASDGSIKILPSPDALAEAVASDVVGGQHYQRIKPNWGPDGTVNEVDDVFGKRLPVQNARKTTFASATVTLGGSTSSTVDCRGLDPVGIEIPPEFDGTAIQFSVSIDGSVFQTLYDLTNTVVQMPVSPSRSYPLWEDVRGFAYLQILTVTPQATTNSVFKIELRG